MTATLHGLVTAGLGKKLATSLGLPQPVRAAPPRAGPAAASTARCWSAATPRPRLAAALRGLLDASASTLRRRRARGGAGSARVVVDLTARDGTGRPGGACAPILGAGVLKRLAPLRPGRRHRSRPRRRPTSPAQRAARRALEGITRSVAKELRAGATANLVLVADGVPRTAPTSALRFLLSGAVGLRRRPGASGSAPRRRGRARRLATARSAGKVAVVTGAARGIGAAIAERRSPATAPPSSASTSRRRASPRARSPTGSAAPRCSSTSRRRTPAGGSSTTPATRHGAARHRRAQRRHHPRQAARQHGRRPLGLGARRQPRLDAADERGAARAGRPAPTAATSSASSSIAGIAGQPRPDQLRGVQGRRHRAGRRATRAAGSARRGITVNAVAPGLHRDRDDGPDPVRDPRARPPAQQPVAGRPAGRRRRDDRLVRLPDASAA